MDNSRKILPLLSSLLLLAQGNLVLAESGRELSASAASVQADASQKHTDGAEKKDEKKSQSSAQKSSIKTEDNSEKSAEKSKEKTAETSKKSSDSPSSPVKPKHNSSYKMGEPMSDPAGSPTRVHRPGTDSGTPPVAPPIGSTPNPDSPMPLYTAPPPAPPREKYPSVGQLEQLMFGHSTPNIIVDNRLDKLESAIFQKNYPDLDIEQRIKRLKDVIVGEEPAHNSAPNPAHNNDSYSSDIYSTGSNRQNPNSTEAEHDPQPKPPFFPNYGHYDLNQELTVSEAEKFAVDVLNEVRAQAGLNEVQWDELGYKVATEQVKDTIKREAVSHQNSKGENPDVRYSGAGGSDSLVESTIMFPAADNLKITRDLVVKMLEALSTRQDDRECLLFPHASGFAMSFNWTPNRHKLFCCTEVLTKHGQMDPIPLEVSVGDKIEVKGNVAAPYKFHKITLAWEGLPQAPSDDGVESTEALPYFPPLDYEAHAIKSNKDFDKGVRILQIAGITAAIAGGLFIPPVALAAPLIAASMGASTPKPVSEIPTKGGVKSDGNSFSHRLTLSNQGKEGLYYLTVWAQTANGTETLPVSRRAIMVRKSSTSDGDKKLEESKADEKNSDVKAEEKDSSKANDDADKKADLAKSEKSDDDSDLSKEERKKQKKALKQAKKDAKKKADDNDIVTSRDELKGDDKKNADGKQPQPGGI